MADKLEPLKKPPVEEPVIPEGGLVPAEQTAAGITALAEPSPPEAKPKPVMTLGSYGQKGTSTPDIVADQVKVPWYNPGFDSKYKGTVGQPQRAKRYDMTAPIPAFIPNPAKIYQKYELPVQTINGQAGIVDIKGGFHPVLNGSYFAHNVPNAVWTPDGRIIQAQNPQEFAGLLYYMTVNGGEDYDPNFKEPTQTYSLALMKQYQEQGDETSVRVALSRNCDAGNCTNQQVEDYIHGRKTLDQIAAETNYQLGRVNNNPIKMREQAMTAQDYLKWAEDNDNNSLEPQHQINEGLQMLASTADYLRMAQDKAREAQNKERLAYLKENGSMDGFEPTITIPEIPDNWDEWDEIPAEFKAWLPDLPADALYSPKQYKAYMEPMMRSLEGEINGKLTGGWTSKVVVPNWADPRYEIRYITPDGQELDRHGNPIEGEWVIHPEVVSKGKVHGGIWGDVESKTFNMEKVESIYNFTNNDVEGFITWAGTNPDQYTDMMTKLLEVNPKLTALLADKVGYTDVAGNKLQYTPEQVNRIAQGQKEPLPPKVQEIIDSVGDVYKDNPTFLMATMDFINDPDKPDSLKNLAIAYVKDFSDPLQSIRMYEVLHNIWIRGVSSGWRDVPYDQWSEKTMKEATGGAKPSMRWGIGAGAASALANSDIQLGHLISEWSDPQLWIIPGEAMAQGKVAVAIAKGAEAKAVINAAKAAAKETGKPAQEILTTMENRFAKAVESVVAPEVKIIPEVKPAAGEIFEAGKITTDEAGNLIKKDNVPYRAIKEGEVIPESAHTDPVTKKIYVPETPQVTEKGAGGAGQPSSEPAKPQGEAVAPEKPPTAPTHEELVAQMKVKNPTATDAELEAAVQAQEAKAARTSPAMTGIDAKIAEKRAKVDAATTKGLWEKGAIDDPEVKAAYKDMVDLAALYMKKGVLTIEEFAKEIGVKVNELVKQAWEAAKLKASFTVEQQTAVDNFKSTAEKFDEAWSKIKAERQAQISRKTKLLDEAQSKGGDITDQMAQENMARSGLLSDMGLKPEDIKISDADLNVMNDMVNNSAAIDPWEKANARRSLYLLQTEGRIPRPFEQKYFEKIFGHDAADLFAMAQKPRAGDYITELLYNSFISPVSNVVNFGGNTIAALFSPVERGVAAGIESGLARVQGRPVAHFGGEVAQDIVGFWSGVPDGVRSWLEVMKTGQATNSALKGEMIRPRAFTGGLGRVVNFNTDMMYAFDELFKSVNSSAALRAESYRMAAKEGLKGAEFNQRLNVLINNPPQELIDAANKISEYRLFRAQSDIANKLIRLRDVEIPGVGHGVKPMQLFIPFVKTPWNLAKFGLERTAASTFNFKMWSNLRAKNPEAADQIARWAIGSAVSTAVTVTAMDGKITGAPPNTVAKRDEFYRLGKQPYSVLIGDKWVSYQRLEPFNQMFLQASMVVDALNNKDKSAGDMAMQFAFATGQNILNQTFLSGLSDTLNAISEPERYAKDYWQRMATGLIPGSSTLRLITQSFDNTIRAPQDLGQQAQANVPGLSQNVPPKLNVFGEAQTRETPAISPYKWSTKKNDTLTNVLVEAQSTPGFVGDSISNIKLNEDQQQEYRVLAGTKLKEQLTKKIDALPDMDWSSKQGKALIKGAIDKSRNDARNEYLKILKGRGITPPKK